MPLAMLPIGPHVPGILSQHLCARVLSIQTQHSLITNPLPSSRIHMAGTRLLCRILAYAFLVLVSLMFFKGKIHGKVAKVLAGSRLRVRKKRDNWGYSSLF